MNPDELLERLRQLDSELLAKTLASLAERDGSILENLICLTASAEEKVRRFKNKIASLRRSKKIIWRRDSQAFAQELREILGLLNGADITPKAGMEAVVDFFKTAGCVFERCDDSSGVLGSVFRIDATKAFVAFASRCDDKAHVEKLLRDLLLSNNHGECDSLPKHIGQMLPAETIRLMIGRFAMLAKGMQDPHTGFSIGCATESLAEGFGDPDFYLEVCSPGGTQIPDFKLLRAARLFLNRGDAAGALSAVNRMTGTSPAARIDKPRLLIEIHQALGNRSELEQLLRSELFLTPSLERLDKLVALKGEAHRETILKEFLIGMLERPGFSASDALFLCEAGHATDVAHYVLERRRAVDGNHYDWVLPLAEHLEMQRLYLEATVLYRALLEHILKTTLYAAYGHGAGYLHKLGEISPLIEDWKSIEAHTPYEAEIRSSHARKKAFWERVAGFAAKAEEKARRTTKNRGGNSGAD